MRRLVRLCALAYPRADRTAVLSLAEELVDGGAPGHREAAGLLRAGLEARLRLTGAPWRGALGQLGLPLAGLLLAAMLLGIRQSPLVWAGWSWTAGLIGAAAALLGLGSGRRWLALPGAALIAALCVVDGARDQYGVGSRWVALNIDVLPALLPAALILMATAAKPRRRGARASAWTLAGAGTLTLAGLAVESHTTPGTTVLAAGTVLVVAMVLRAVRLGAAPEDRLAAALALAAAAPAAGWWLAGAAPTGGAPDMVPQLLLAGLALAATAVILRLARSAVPRRK